MHFYLLQYLHNEKRLLHGDMKSCNVVVKGDFEAIKICDVGVSLHMDENMKSNECCFFAEMIIIILAFPHFGAHKGQDQVLFAGN